MAVVAAPRDIRARRAWLTFGRRQAMWGYLLVLPAVLLLLGLVAYPFVYAIYISFTSRVVGDPGEWVGFRNFRYLLQWSSFNRAISNTVLLVIVSDIAKLTIGLGLALLLNEQIRGRGAFRALVLLPWAMPGFVAFPDLEAVAAADRGRGQLVADRIRSDEPGGDDRAGPEWNHQLAGTTLDRLAGGDHRHGLARLPLLVYLVSGGAAERAE